LFLSKHNVRAGEEEEHGTRQIKNDLAQNIPVIGKEFFATTPL